MPDTMWKWLAGTPILGWLGYVQVTKLPRQEFLTYTDEHNKLHDSTCKKLEEMHDDIKTIEKFLMGGKWDGQDRRRVPRN